mgnify:CR=1 FL=1
MDSIQSSINRLAVMDISRCQNGLLNGMLHGFVRAQVVFDLVIFLGNRNCTN